MLPTINDLSLSIVPIGCALPTVPMAATETIRQLVWPILSTDLVSLNLNSQRTTNRLGERIGIFATANYLNNIYTKLFLIRNIFKVRLFSLSCEAPGRGGGVNYKIIDNYNSYYLDLIVITFFNYVNLFTDASLKMQAMSECSLCIINA